MASTLALAVLLARRFSMVKFIAHYKQPADPAAFDEHLLVRREGRVGIVQINRPKAMNALSTPLMAELVQALRELDQDDAIGALVVTGDERAFAAGADIKEMAGVAPMELWGRGSLDL